ncbi:MAG: hypothetical protein JW715_05070 [Sedimentisphaerales bacterium]|nr:hypothetical protein [Sedimentisphaerales bacterium]
MKNEVLKTNFIVALLCLMNSLGIADYPVEVKINVAQKNIGIGEPLILKVIFRFENPQVTEERGKILDSINHQMSIRIYHKEDLTNEIFLSKRKHFLYLENNKGLVYGGSIILLYDDYKNKLIFDSPGTYTIIAKRTNTLSSNPLDINITPASALEKEMLSMLSDPGDFDFIVYGSKTHFEKKPERISIIKDFIDKYENTVLAQMAAARLGIEYAERLEEKYPAGEKFLQQYRKGEIKEPLVESAYDYFLIAYNLTDEFPVRESVLNKLAVMEFFKGNYKSVDSIFDELANKYPHGEHGKRAARDKEEFKSLIARYPELFSKDEKKPLSVVLPVTGVVIAGIFIVAYILLRQKKIDIQKNQEISQG